MSNPTSLLLTYSNQTVNGKKKFDDIETNKLKIDYGKVTDKYDQKHFIYRPSTETNENTGVYNWQGNTQTLQYFTYFDPNWSTYIYPGIYKIEMKISINRANSYHQLRLAYTNTIQPSFFQFSNTSLLTNYNYLDRRIILLNGYENLEQDNLNIINGILVVNTPSLYHFGAMWTSATATVGKTFLTNVPNMYLLIQTLTNY